MSHLETCRDCRNLVAADRDLVDALARLPLLEPAPGFEQRVLARVAVVGAGEAAVAALLAAAWPQRAAGCCGERWRWADRSRPGWGGRRCIRLRRLVWPRRWSARPGHALWQSLQRLTDTAHNLGWISGIRGALATPLRALAITALAAATYAAALGGLGRLLAEPAPHAGW